MWLGAASGAPRPACPRGENSCLPNGQLKWLSKGTMPNANAFSVVAIFNSVQYLLTYFPWLGYLQCSQSQGWRIWTLCKYSSHFQSGSHKVGSWPWTTGWASWPAHGLSRSLFLLCSGCRLSLLTGEASSCCVCAGALRGASQRHSQGRRPLKGRCLLLFIKLQIRSKNACSSGCCVPQIREGTLILVCTCINTHPSTHTVHGRWSCCEG